MPTRLLKEAGHDITVFYANSNIAPANEYDHRLVELKKYASAEGFAVLEGAYDPAKWKRIVAPIGESLRQYSPAFGAEAAHTPSSVSELLDDERRKERCRACYRMRLEESAALAARDGYDALTTTLAVSPYQFTDVIREELERACTQAHVGYYFEDYRPYYDEATRISRELGMYRQNYCGCAFSIKEGEATRAFVKEQRKLKKAMKRQADALQIERVELERKQKAQEKQAYADAQTRKRAILKKLRERNKRSGAE